MVWPVSVPNWLLLLGVLTEGDLERSHQNAESEHGNHDSESEARKGS